MTINEVTDRVISSVDNSWTTLEKIRYVYLAVGKMLSKYTDFFFSVDNKLGEQQLSMSQIEEVYEDEKKDGDLRVICWIIYPKTRNYRHKNFVIRRGTKHVYQLLMVSLKCQLSRSQRKLSFQIIWFHLAKWIKQIRKHLQYVSMKMMVVLVYSKLPEEWKAEYPNTKFVEYQDWASRMRED